MHADVFGIIIQIACALLAYDSVYSCTVVLQSAYMLIWDYNAVNTCIVDL